jgi:type II secretory pathway pseudopilin PulG
VAGGRRAPRCGGHAAGYALVALIVIVAVMNVLVAATLPYWSQVIKRDKEAELIFRGLQYAEAIRVFQLRFGRLPNSLDELIEVNPRSIRRLWADPMTDNGEWELIRAQVGQRGAAQGREVAGGTAPGGRDTRRGGRRRGRQRAAGPIVGVRSRSKEEATRTFMGSDSYGGWHFTAELIPTPVTVPDTLLIPRPTSDWIGKPFREDLQPKGGSGPQRTPGTPPQGGNDDG